MLTLQLFGLLFANAVVNSKPAEEEEQAEEEETEEEESTLANGKEIKAWLHLKNVKWH